MATVFSPGLDGRVYATALFFFFFSSGDKHKISRKKQRSPENFDSVIELDFTGEWPLVLSRGLWYFVV